MKMTKVLLALVWLGCFATAQAITGNEIMEKVDLNYQYLTNSSVVNMTIVKSENEKRIREFNLSKKKETPAKSKTLIKFTTPANIRGTGLLIFKEDRTADRQWLYLSADKMVKDVIGSEKQKSFMGSDFTHEDISGHPFDAFEHTLTKEVTIDGKLCYEIHSLPKKGVETGYGELVNYIRKDIFFPAQIDFKDDKGTLVKTLINENITKESKYYYAQKVTMKNILNNTFTTLEVKKISLDQPLSDFLFTQQGLKK